MQHSPLSTNLLPLQGVDFLGNRTRRDAAGWHVLPFQGEGLTGPPKKWGEHRPQTPNAPFDNQPL
ncbi:MAG: hypothetical protein LBG58_17320, partial [Planctomycetaceae bacterium]|nr:hypothetical protein [Planctomycetaceae bacterium]